VVRGELLKLAIVGAGSVGLVLAARLAQAGVDVLLVTRGEPQAREIAAEGLRLEDPTSGRVRHAELPVLAGIPAAGPQLGDRTVVACHRSPQTPAVVEALARAAPEAVVAAAQNGAEPEAPFAAQFRTVLGVVVRFTATRIGPGAARAAEGGRLVVGRHPEGTGPEAASLAAAFRTAGFDTGLSTRLSEDRWLKLCLNLLSAPNAMIRREDHGEEAFVELKARLLEEARGVLRAAGIPAASCDGRDRSLTEEIARQRASLADGTSARRLPLYNQVWRALREGGPVEADGYYRTVLALAARHGVEAPLNARMLEAVERAVREETGPERLRARDFL